VNGRNDKVRLANRVTIPPSKIRAIQPRISRTNDFVFVSPSQQPDIAIRRVGVNAGRIFENEPEKCSKQSHFFLKAVDIEQRLQILQRLRSLDLEKASVKYNTAGCPSISKTELCILYDEICVE